MDEHSKRASCAGGGRAERKLQTKRRRRPYERDRDRAIARRYNAGDRSAAEE